MFVVVFVFSFNKPTGRQNSTWNQFSFDAWTKYYRQDENAPNAIVSYYTKGSLVALALDLTIRTQTDGERSLDDVMRALWVTYGRDFYAAVSFSDVPADDGALVAVAPGRSPLLRLANGVRAAVERGGDLGGVELLGGRDGVVRLGEHRRQHDLVRHRQGAFELPLKDPAAARVGAAGVVACLHVRRGGCGAGRCG